MSETLHGLKIHASAWWLALSLAACASNVGAQPPAPDSGPEASRETLMKMPYRQIVERYYGSNFYLGTANHARGLDGLSTRIADREFGYITPSNDFKQSYVHPEFDRWRWDNPDSYVRHAREAGQVLRIHGPISPQCSKWAREDCRTAEEMRRMLEEYMTALCKRYNEVEYILWMDVVNETISKQHIKDPLRDPIEPGDWFAQRVGNDLWENPWPVMGYDTLSALKVPLYIDKAFELSNRHAPRLKQIINQDGQFEEFVWEKIKKLVEYLRERGRRVDGVGWQAHIETGWELVPGNLERLDRFITWCHANGLEFHITEMNVWIKDRDTSREKDQAETFAAVIDTVVKHRGEGVVGINFWNVRDQDTANPTWMGCIWRNDGTPRPAYDRIKEVLIDNIQ